MAIEGTTDLSLEKAEVIGILIIAALLVFAFSCVLIPMLAAHHGEHAEQGEGHVAHGEHTHVTEHHTTAPHGEHTEQASSHAESHG